MIQVKANTKSSVVILALLVALIVGLFVIGVYDRGAFVSYVTTMGSMLAVIGGVFVNHTTTNSNLSETKSQTPDIQAIKSQTNGVIAAQFSAVHERIDTVVTDMKSFLEPISEALNMVKAIQPPVVDPTPSGPATVTGSPTTPVPVSTPDPVSTPTPVTDPKEPTPVTEPVIATPAPVTPTPVPEPVKATPEPVKPAPAPASTPDPVPVGTKNSVTGIDVASYQGENFSTDGLSFGFAKRSQGTDYLNPWWAAQIEKFRRAAMLCGHYLFLEPGSDTNIREQVDYFLKNLTYKTGEDLILVDWETRGCSEHMRDLALHSLMPHFAHNRVGTYCNLDFWLHIDTESYPGDFLFIADPSAPEGEPRIHYNWKFDQYSSTDGLDHDVASFTSKAAMLEWARGK